MLRRLLLVCVIVLGLAGCSTTQQFAIPTTPGLFALPDGGYVQLLYSNPNYMDSLDSSVTGEYMLHPTQPAVQGGLGIMAQWHF